MNKAMSDINERTRLDGNAPNTRLAQVLDVERILETPTRPTSKAWAPMLHCQVCCR